jgi:predicted esterase
MRTALLALTCASLCACASDTSGEGEDTGTTQADTTDTSSTSEGTETGGDSELLPVPEDLPTPTGACPSFASGDVTFSPATIAPRPVKLWVGDNPQPGGMLVIYWHAYGSVPDEASYALSPAVIDAILANGGVVAAPYPADDVGEYPWFAVSVSPRQDDMLVGDEIVACALQEVGIDPRRIHATGMSAGGLQTTAYSMARSRYIASVTTFSGGEYSPLSFEAPDNRFAAMIIHGGDDDIFGGVVNFKMLSSIWYNQLIENGNFAFMCDHGGGHTIPLGWGADVVNFLFAHPFGTQPSPYATGLPPEFPSACSL